MKNRRTLLSFSALVVLLAGIGLFQWNYPGSRFSRSPASFIPGAPGTSGENDDQSCELDPAKPDLICNLDSVPGYFANVTPDGKYVAYIDYNNPKYGGLSDWLVSMSDCKTKVRIPGLTDPVPSPDGLMIATPNTPSTPHSGYALYNWSKIAPQIIAGQTTQPKLKPDDFEPKIVASYESIGVLKPQDASGKTTYRIAGGAAVFNDFQRVGDTITHQGAYDRPACTNINNKSNPNKLPKISKDGKFIGNYVTANNADRTEIYALHDNGTCTLALDLGIPTGKVEFSYDGRQIAFHVDSFASDGNSHFTIVARNMVKNVYVMDVDPVGDKLVAKGIRKITNNTTPGSGSYYPSFDKQGNVVYIQQNITPDGKVNYAFERVNPSLNSSIPLFTEINSNGCRPKDSNAFFALGDLYQCVCPIGKKLQSAPVSALWSLGLTHESCENLVRKHWDEKKAQVKNSLSTETRAPGAAQIDPNAIGTLTVNDLLAACPAPNRAGPAHPTVLGKTTSLVNQVPDNGQRDPGKIFVDDCAECHNGSQQLDFEWNKLASDPTMHALIPDMIRRIGDPDDHITPAASDDQAMPKGSRMNPTQARILVKALKAIENLPGTANGQQFPVGNR